MAMTIFRRSLAVLIRAAILLAITAVAWRWLKPRQMPLAEMLFYVGAGPIALFAIGRFGEFFGRGDASYQLGRSVMTPASRRRAQQDVADLDSREKSGWSWIFAGLILWGVSYFLEI